MSNKYREAGVDLEAGYESVRLIKSHVARTKVLGAVDSIGAFGGMFDLSLLNMKEPVLVSGTDGVGTKLQLAIDWNMHTTIGIDLVAMCVNDILAQGAKPLFFLDYLAVGKNVPSRIEEIVAGVSQGCIQSDAALIGGETAEMPGMYAEDSYDLAGFAVGIAERHELIDVNNVKAGDAIIGLASTGIHSNGYSLVRKILSDSQIEITEELKAMVMEPTKIYVKEVLELMKRVKVHAAVHNTGGGFIENLPRALAAGLGANIKLGSWDIPEVFEILKEAGQMDTIEMMNVFNMGIGFMLIVSPEDKEEVMNILGDQAFEIGQVVSGEGVSFV